jgi:hypothetical protein
MEIDSWSNEAALGYAQEAAKNIGLSVGKTTKLLIEMHALFDFRTVNEAAEKFRREE